MIGKRDFRTFMSSNKEDKTVRYSYRLFSYNLRVILAICLQKKPSFSKRRLDSIEIVPGKSLNVQNKESNFEYWEIRVKAKSFVYRQVRRRNAFPLPFPFLTFDRFQIRRIVGTLIAAGEGKITERDVYEMVTIPSRSSWLRPIKIAPAHGLYLVSIEYPRASNSFDLTIYDEKQRLLA